MLWICMDGTETHHQQRQNTLSSQELEWAALGERGEIKWQQPVV